MLLDILCGLAFLGGGLVTRRTPMAMRAWWVLTGVAWWLGDFAPLRLVHQGVLLGALAVFPVGRPRSVGQYAALGIGALVATGCVGQVGSAVGFLVTAAIVGRRRAFTRLAAGVVGLWLAGAFVSSRVSAETFQPSRALVGYELVLLAVAVTLPWGIAVERRRRGALTDRLLAGGSGGLVGLEQALRTALRRRTLRLTRAGGDIVVEGLGAMDTETSVAVDRAVALVVAHEQALAASEARLRDLEEARVRLLVAADTERVQAAGRLRRDLATLRSCAATLAGMPEVAGELADAVADIERIVTGLPPEGLGCGGLRPALTQLCARHPVPVAITCDERATGDVATETALYYVCSEALANSVKHARASRVEVSLRGGRELVLTIVDDGVGGADSGGAGLLGIQDRLAAVSGTLTVESRHNAGTRVEARAPARSVPDVQSIRT